MMYIRQLTSLLLLLIVPAVVDAATLKLVPSPARANQEFSIEVRINPEGESINAVEGIIAIPPGMLVSYVSTGGSAFAVWPVAPTFSRATSNISFTGGIMGQALPPAEDSLLFTMYVTAPVEGTYSVSESGTGFRADGTGTPVILTVSKVDVKIGTENIPSESIFDIEQPKKIVAELGSDPALFDNAPFVYLYAVDNQSGIVGYAVKEGWFAPFVSTDQYYVLKDATAGSPVWVRATDAKGNSRNTHVEGTGGHIYQVFTMLPYACIALLIGLLVWLRLRR